MSLVIHRGTEISTILDVVDDQGNIIASEPAKYRLSNLTKDDFDSALKSLNDVKDALQQKYGKDRYSAESVTQKMEDLESKLKAIDTLSEKVDKLTVMVSGLLKDVPRKAPLEDLMSEADAASKSECINIDADTLNYPEQIEVKSLASLADEPAARDGETKTRFLARKAKWDREQRQVRALARKNNVDVAETD